MEEDKDGQEGSRAGGVEESQRNSELCRQERWYEWKRSGKWTYAVLPVLLFYNDPTSQFQYNPEWFQDEDDGDGSDDWDLDQFRREKEEEDRAAEEQRIATMALHDSGGQ